MDVKRGINRICILVALVGGSIFAFIDLKAESDRAVGARLMCIEHTDSAARVAEETLCPRSSSSLQDTTRGGCLQRNDWVIKRVRGVAMGDCSRLFGPAIPGARVVRRILSPGFLFSIFAIVGVTFGGTHAVYRIVRWIHRGLTGQKGGGNA